MAVDRSAIAARYRGGLDWDTRLDSRQVGVAAKNGVVALSSTSQTSDAELAEAAVSALEHNVAVPDDQIAVYVRDGWVTLEGRVAMWFQKSAAAGTVTLEGMVHSRGEKQQAEQAAWRAPGVSRVVNNLNVQTK